MKGLSRQGAVKWRGETGPAENARLRLPKLARKYFAEVRAVLARNPDPSELHQIRLASKHLRYTLELFRDCYAAGLKERLEALKKLQDLLGDCNDAVSSLATVEKALRLPREERRRVRTHLEKVAAEKAEAFHKHWKQVFDADGQEAWWTGYLERGARPPRKAKASA